MRETPLVGAYGKIQNFLDVGSLFVVSTVPSTSYQTLYYAVYPKSTFDTGANILKNINISLNISNIKIEYELVYRNNWYLPLVSAMYSDLAMRKTNLNCYMQYALNSTSFSEVRTSQFDGIVTKLAYLKNLMNATDYNYYIVQTPI